MKYDELCKLIEEESTVSFDTVKSVLSALPHALSQLDEREQVRTPCGTFAAWPKEAKEILLPTGEKVNRKSEVVVRLRPGKALKRSR
jgi:nucleoid DNA-binding protein